MFDKIDKHVEWLRDKVMASNYATYDNDDPVMQIMLECELKRRGLGITLKQLEELDRLKRSISQHLGEFWQRTLADMDGWEDLGIGHESGCDLRNETTKHVIELKNKWNTMNSSSKTAIIQKLKVQNENGYTGVIGIINDKTKSGTMRVDQNGVIIASGEKLFSLVCGESGKNLLDDVQSKIQASYAIDECINHLIQTQLHDSESSDNSKE